MAETGAAGGVASGAATGAMSGAPLGIYGMAAGAAIGAASAFMGFSASNKAEKEARDAAEYQAAIAKQQYELQKESIAAARREAEHKTTMDLHDSTVMFMRQRASVVAGAGEAGVAGGSVTRTVVASVHAEQDVRGRQMYALEQFKDQSARELSGAQLGMAGQVTQYKGTDSSTLAFTAGLEFASTALSVYGDYKKAGD